MNEPNELAALTKRQRDVVCFVGRWLVEPVDGSRVRTDLSNLSRDVVRMAGGGPSLDEICAGMGLRSRGSLHKHISALIEADLVEPMRGQHRGVRLTDAGLKLAQLLLAASQSGEPATVRELNGPREVPASDASTSIDSMLPLMGSIAAGRPIEAINESIEIEVPAHLRSDGPCYVLRVKGDSMIDEGILDGDLVVVEHRETARNGEIVVALVDGEEATLKRINQRPGVIELIPANAAMRAMAYSPDRVQVQGVLVAQMRRY